MIINSHSRSLATSKNLEDEYFLNMDCNDDASTFFTNYRRSIAIPLTSSSLYPVFFVRVAFHTEAYVPLITRYEA